VEESVSILPIERISPYGHHALACFDGLGLTVAPPCRRRSEVGVGDLPQEQDLRLLSVRALVENAWNQDRPTKQTSLAAYRQLVLLLHLIPNSAQLPSVAVAAPTRQTPPDTSMTYGELREETYIFLFDMCPVSVSPPLRNTDNARVDRLG